MRMLFCAFNLLVHVSDVCVYKRHSLDSMEYQWLLALLICFLSVVEIVVAIASASVTCCCAHVRGTQVSRVITDVKYHTNDPMQTAYMKKRLRY